ncbi:MAG: sigma-70 family RNA polymerase sigma factor [Armatimonadetes bacterium]|nr:sigma-70 family RNA polymerase sigma factor [Armatimonadota bacterium]
MEVIVDSERFEGTAIPHLEALYRTARRWTGNDKDAEDLVQETYMRAYRFFSQFQPGTNIRAWLFKIMGNTHINIYRKNSREGERVSLDEIPEFYLYQKAWDDDAFSQYVSPHKAVLEEFLDEDVLIALEKLPMEFRLAVVLADIEEFTYQEIADILECPVGTVRSRISRGRKLLQKYLWEYAKKAQFARETSA